MRFFIFSALCGFVLFGCNRLPDRFPNLDTGLQYIADNKNNFIVEKTFPNQVKVRVQLIPAVFIQKENKASKRTYFSVQFSYNGSELLAQLPKQEYGTYVQLFSFGMEPLIKLTATDGKEYAAALVSYQPTYNLAKSNELLVVFDENFGTAKDLVLEIDEFGLNLGKLKFSFDKSRFNYSPIIDKF